MNDADCREGLAEGMIKLLMSNLPELLQELMERRGLTQKDAALLLQISPAMLSRYMTQGAVPRRSTLARIADLLCTSPEERAMLEAAAGKLTADSGGDEVMEAASDYMRAKVRSIEFEKDVELRLESARIPFLKHFCQDNYIVDFVTKTKHRIGIQLKSNLHIDWERALADCILVREHLVDDVVLCIPYFSDALAMQQATKLFDAAKIKIVTFNDLVPTLKQMGA